MLRRFGGTPEMVTAIREGSDMKQVWIPRSDAAVRGLGAYVAWLQPVPWQLFATLTFAWQISDPQATKVFREFVNRMEAFLHTPIGYVRGDEKRFSGCGMPGAPRHFHVLLTADRQLDRRYVADLWMSMAGRREHGAGADVRPFNSSLPGIAYVLKFINQSNGDWDLRNLDLFLPDTEIVPLTARQRRRLARHKSRVASHQNVTELDQRNNCAIQMKSCDVGSTNNEPILNG
jgi:hypothetical protein